MLFTGPVAAFTADGQAVENRLAVAIQRSIHMIDLIAVAEQAGRRHRAAEMLVFLEVPGGQVPDLTRLVPGAGRLEEIPILLHHVAAAFGTRAYRKNRFHFAGEFANRLTGDLGRSFFPVEPSLPGQTH